MAAFVQGFGRDPYPCNSRLLTRHRQPSVGLAWRTALFWILGDRRAWFVEQWSAIRRRYLLRSFFDTWFRALFEAALLPELAPALADTSSDGSDEMVDRSSEDSVEAASGDNRNIDRFELLARLGALIGPGWVPP